MAGEVNSSFRPRGHVASGFVYAPRYLRSVNSVQGYVKAGSAATGLRTLNRLSSWSRIFTMPPYSSSL